MKITKLALAALLLSTGSAHAQYSMQQMMDPNALMNMMAPMMAPMGQMVNPAMMNPAGHDQPGESTRP
jgi:hypothetical protein